MRTTTSLRLLLLLALAVPAVACSSGGGAPTCDNPVTTTNVALKDFEYDPSCVAATASDTLTIANDGGSPHTFTVKGTDVSVNLDAGDQAQIALTGVAPGTYTVVCNYHPQMVGALKITG
jgi:plastocyanin